MTDKRLVTVDSFHTQLYDIHLTAVNKAKQPKALARTSTHVKSDTAQICTGNNFKIERHLFQYSLM